ncbi:hypothetical protein Bca4012_099743 [Brassica carinata]
MSNTHWLLLLLLLGSHLIVDPSDPDPVMAGAVARILKRVGLPPLGVVDVISIGSLPVLADIYFRQEKQFAWLDEQEKRVNATVADMGVEE